MYCKLQIDKKMYDIRIHLIETFCIVNKIIYIFFFIVRLDLIETFCIVNLLTRLNNS